MWCFGWNRYWLKVHSTISKVAITLHCFCPPAFLKSNLNQHWWSTFFTHRAARSAIPCVSDLCRAFRSWFQFGSSQALLHCRDLFVQMDLRFSSGSERSSFAMDFGNGRRPEEPPLHPPRGLDFSTFSTLWGPNQKWIWTFECFFAVLQCFFVFSLYWNQFESKFQPVNFLFDFSDRFFSKTKN